MTFEVYLVEKRINSARFKEQAPEQWIEWQDEFEHMHPESFTAQKLFLINAVRRKYPLLKPSS